MSKADKKFNQLETTKALKYKIIKYAPAKHGIKNSENDANVLNQQPPSSSSSLSSSSSTLSSPPPPPPPLPPMQPPMPSSSFPHYTLQGIQPASVQLNTQFSHPYWSHAGLYPHYEGYKY